MSKRKFTSLKLKLFFSVVLSMAVAVVIFGMVFLIGNVLLDNTVYGHSFAEQMADTQFDKLQGYVEKESISTDNLQRLTAWCSRGEKVYLALYQGENLIFRSHISNSLDNIQGYDPDLEDPESEYILTLHGDVQVRAFLYYYAGDAYYYLITVLSGILAFVAFSICFILLINKKISYVGTLKDELDILSGGQLNYKITVDGNDELGELALGIDQMRQSILRHQEAEKQMRSANSELITAMSHDLRTPLTSLLAYLEIVERGKYADEEQMKSLIHKSVGQTMRIKNMADKLFEYFLAYATEWESVEMENVDADGLFGQILGDYAYALESSGMKVETEFSEISAQLSVNAELLQRALDNLYSNLLKYAEPSECVRFTYKKHDHFIHIGISNTIKVGHKKNDSTSMGLIICRRIIEYHGGHFWAEEISGRFVVKVSLPLQE